MRDRTFLLRWSWFKYLAYLISHISMDWFQSPSLFPLGYPFSRTRAVPPGICFWRPTGHGDLGSSPGWSAWSPGNSPQEPASVSGIPCVWKRIFQALGGSWRVKLLGSQPEDQWVGQTRAHEFTQVAQPTGCCSVSPRILWQPRWPRRYCNGSIQLVDRLWCALVIWHSWLRHHYSLANGIYKWLTIQPAMLDYRRLLVEDVTGNNQCLDVTNTEHH